MANHDPASFGLDARMNRILRVQQLSERGGEMGVCWDKAGGRVRIMGRCVEVGQGEVRLGE